MKTRIAFAFTLLILLFACASNGNKEITSSKDTIPTLSKLKYDSNTFNKTIFFNARHKVDSLVNAYEKTYNQKLKEPENEVSYSISRMDKRSLESLSKLEFLYYVIAYPESYSQNCNIIAVHYFGEMKKNILFRIPSRTDMDFSTERIESLKKNTAIYESMLDSIINNNLNDTILLPNAIKVYTDLNQNKCITFLIEKVKNNKDPLFATALLSMLDRKDSEWVMKNLPLKLNEYGDTDPWPYTPKNVELLTQCAEKWLEK